MSDSTTKRMLAAYSENLAPPMFLSSFFRTPPENFHESEKVEIDVLREDADVAVPVPAITDPRKVELSKYVNKAFTPAIVDLVSHIDGLEKLSREAGSTGFDNVFDDSRIRGKALMALGKVERMIRRTVEWMSAQVLQTGVITLVDSAGATIYNVDFKPKTAHFATTGTLWADNGSTGDPLGDLEAKCDLCRQDGQESPNKLIFGKTALRKFFANADVQNQLFQNRYADGQVKSVAMPSGATRKGDVWIGSYLMEIWAYNGYFKHPNTGANTPFVADDKVIVMSDTARLDMTYGSIPLVVPPDARASIFLPPRIMDSGRGFDMSVNAWVEPNGRSLAIGAGTRPLPIPTAIDSFACLDVVP